MKYAHNAATRTRTVHSIAELRMALEDKARGQRIASLRKRKRLTQQAMAEQLRIAYRTYQTWEAGRMPEWDNVLKLSAFHGVRPEDLIGEDAPLEVGQVATIEGKLDALALDLVERLERIETLVTAWMSDEDLAAATARDADVAAAEPPRGAARSGSKPNARGTRARRAAGE
jgi:Helix-turn-helix.